MKFGQHLHTHLVPEWESEYFDYEGIKDRLDVATQNAQFLEKNDVPMPHTKLSFDVGTHRLKVMPQGTSIEAVFRYIDKQVTKSNKFYITQFKRALGNLLEFNSKLSMMDKRQKHEVINIFIELTNLEFEPIFCRGTRNFKPNGIRVPKAEIITADKILNERREQWPQPHPIELEFESKKALWTPRLLQSRSQHEQKDIRRIFIELFRLFVFLNNFKELNKTAVAKILKKLDKDLKQEFLDTYLPLVNAEYMFSSDSITRLLTILENVWVERMSGTTNRSVAMDLLREAKQTDHREQQDPVQVFWLGVWCGVTIFLILIPFIFRVKVVHYFMHIPFGPAHAVFRGFGVAILMGWCWGLNTIGWHKARINYGYIFNMPFRVNYIDIFQICGIMTALWLLLLYVMVDPDTFSRIELSRKTNETLWGGVFFALTIALSLNPFRVGQRGVRTWFLGALKRCFLAGLRHVRFVDFWLADQLVSLAILFSDLEFLVCFYVSDAYSGTSECEEHLKYSRPLFVLLPYSMRVLQCLRKYWGSDRTSKKQLANALKYSTSITITVFSALSRLYSANFFAVWIFFSLVGLGYNYYWDLVNDWGFFTTKRTDQVWPLRGGLKLAHGKKFHWFYYWAMVSNFILRLTWVLSISEKFPWNSSPFVVSVVTSACEVLRRFQWNFLRLEYEHTFNAENYRAVTDIPIPRFLHTQPSTAALQRESERSQRDIELANGENESQHSGQESGRAAAITLLRTSPYNEDPAADEL